LVRDTTRFSKRLHRFHAQVSKTNAKNVCMCKLQCDMPEPEPTTGKSRDNVMIFALFPILSPPASKIPNPRPHFADTDPDGLSSSDGIRTCRSAGGISILKACEALHSILRRHVLVSYLQLYPGRGTYAPVLRVAARWRMNSKMHTLTLARA
jgi:hypothetical protein